jgi:copper chaperone CopZ
VKYIRANAMNHTVIVEYDDQKTGIDEFKEALGRRGYDVTGVQFLE